MRSTTRIVAAAFVLALVAACAPEVVRQPVELAPTATSSRVFETLGTTDVPLGTGYSRTIVTGVRLVEAGAIRQGRVLRPTNTVFSVEGAHVHEAYAVVDGGRLVGFYLPFERAFAPLPSPVDFPLKDVTP